MKKYETVCTCRVQPDPSVLPLLPRFLATLPGYMRLQTRTPSAPSCLTVDTRQRFGNGMRALIAYRPTVPCLISLRTFMLGRCVSAVGPLPLGVRCSLQPGGARSSQRSVSLGIHERRLNASWWLVSLWALTETRIKDASRMFTEKNMLSHVARPRPILHFIRRSMEFITCKCARRVATSLGRSASLCAAVQQRCARRLFVCDPPSLPWACGIAFAMCDRVG